MPRTRATEHPELPPLLTALSPLSIDQLKWYAEPLQQTSPKRKGELLAAVVAELTKPETVRRLWGQLSAAQQQVVAEVIHHFAGRYEEEPIVARAPGTQQPRHPRSSEVSRSMGYGRKHLHASAYDLLFVYTNDAGLGIASDIAALLRQFVPPPPQSEMESTTTPPTISLDPRYRHATPHVFVSSSERAVFHDLGATLTLVEQGKVSVGKATRLPSLASVRALREQLLVADYLNNEPERAEDAVRPLALLLLVQAAGWAAPSGAAGTKLALTPAGQALFVGPLEASHIKAAWQAWIKTDLIDELSRIRNIRGQQSGDVRLSGPAPRRAKLNQALQAAPVGRWVTTDELFRYIRAAQLSPTIERQQHTGLYLGSYQEYGWLGYQGVNYWDIVVGSYLRAVLWEYAATLGLIESAYTLPEASPHSFGDAYGLDETPYLSRYDGLLGLQVTNLGAYVFGHITHYTPPQVAAVETPLLAVLPNLDLVLTDQQRASSIDRAMLERIGSPQQQNVYRLDRELLLEAEQRGLTVGQVKEFISSRAGLPEAEPPQTVQVFFQDLERRINALRDAGKMLVLTADDGLLLTELANTAGLRGFVQLGSIGDQPVLLVPEAEEAAVRKTLRKLGYVPRRQFAVGDS